MKTLMLMVLVSLAWLNSPAQTRVWKVMEARDEGDDQKLYVHDLNNPPRYLGTIHVIRYKIPIRKGQTIRTDYEENNVLVGNRKVPIVAIYYGKVVKKL